MNKGYYIVPEIEVHIFDVEQGFLLSNLENPVENPEQEW